MWSVPALCSVLCERGPDALSFPRGLSETDVVAELRALGPARPLSEREEP